MENLKYDNNTLKQIRNRIANSEPIKIVLGAGDVWYGHDWIATNQEDLDILVTDDWKFLFGDFKADYIVAEHVWEHFDEKQAVRGLRNVFNFLKKGGNFRIAVPDGYFPNEDYISHVKPGGIGAGADDHKILYNHKTFVEVLEKVPFMTTLIEYWDENGEFHNTGWKSEIGHISRSRFNDERNNDLEINYTSIIVDCKK